MAGTFDMKKAAITLGLVFALGMLVWDLLVAAGGSMFIKLVEGMHFISTPLATAPFDFIMFVAGIICAFIMGAIAGAIFVYIYEKI